MIDKEKDVTKAVSWILREITKKNPDKVARFLIKWAETKSTRNTKKIIKDGMKKLSEEKQNEISIIMNE